KRKKAMKGAFEREEEGLIFVAEGVLSGEALIRETERAHGAHAGLRYQIIDLRQVERMDITAEQIQRIAEADREAAERGPGAKLAIVPTHGMPDGPTRIYLAPARTAKLESRIFCYLDAARRCIGDGREKAAARRR